jgi:tRNA1Val (adenine37-N6)-methyltransferase
MFSADELEARRAALETELGEPITVDGLSATLRIFQRKKGHRHSTDDLLTAWYALEKSPPVTRALDLGTGIGTVGLLVLAGMPAQMSLTCIEAQDVSYRFLRENLRANGVEERVHAHHGDLRELALEERFPLVTGSPPYFDVAAGIVPSDSQKAHARFELRGDVRDYARAARRHLEDDGLFVFCFPWPQKARALAAVRDEGFARVAHRDVVPRTGLAPLFSLLACRLKRAVKNASVPSSEADADAIEPPFVVRNADGSHTEAMHEVRARFGWPPSNERSR